MMQTVEERFWSKVDPSGDCWVWTSTQYVDGYGKFWSRTPPHGVRAHRYAYEALVGPIPEGLSLDHLCRNRACVNPDHLEPVTNRENLRRSPIAPATVNANRTHCQRGHPLSGDNVRIRKQGWRLCLECERQRYARDPRWEHVDAAIDHPPEPFRDVNLTPVWACERCHQPVRLNRPFGRSAESEPS